MSGRMEGPWRRRRWRACSRGVLLLLLTSLMFTAAACATSRAAPPPVALGAASVREYQVPSTAAYPDLIVLAPDGSLWFTEARADAGRIGHMTSAGAISELAVHTVDMVPFGLAWGPDGNLWVLESGTTADHPNGSLLRISPAGRITNFPLPRVGVGHPYGNNLTVGPDGALWFTQSALNTIGRMTTSGVLTEFPLPSADAMPGAITAGPDGNLWFTEAQLRHVCRITPSGEVSEFAVNDSYGQLLGSIVAGPQNSLWFTDASGFTSPVQRPHDYIGTVTPRGKVSLFPLPTLNASPRGIAVGPDGSVWFTEASPEVSRIGRITPSGTLTEYALPHPSSEPANLAVTTAGAVWVTELALDRVAMLTPTQSSSTG